MKALIIVRGLPGSGKTTVAEMFASKIFDTVVSADDFFYKTGEYKFDPTQLGAAHEYCRNKAAESIISGAGNVFVANTFTTENEIQPYKEMAEQLGVPFISLIVENRHGNDSIHNVPCETVEKMKNRFTVKL